MGPRDACVRRTLTTVRATREIDEIFRRGERSVDELLTVFSSETPERYGSRGRLVFIAGRKIGNAVIRNRCKRVMREAVRRAGGPWRDHDIALIARPGLLRATAADLDGSIRRHVDRLRVL
jgi:ribonuclease P protein component